MAQAKKTVSQRTVEFALALVFGVLVGVVGTRLFSFSSAASLSPVCSGSTFTRNGGSFYQFTGIAFRKNTQYGVTITLPDQSTFVAPVTADANGAWTTSWLASGTGTYSGIVSTVGRNGLSKAVTSCSSVTAQ